MRHIAIVIKFMIITILFGAVSVGTSVYSGAILGTTSNTYSQLLTHEIAASSSLADASISLQKARASIGDLLMSQSDSSKAASAAELSKAKEAFAAQLDAAYAALPRLTQVPKLKEQGLDLINGTCASAIKAANVSTAADEIQVSQQVALIKCRPGFGVLTTAFAEEMRKINDGTAFTSLKLVEDSKNAIIITISCMVAGLVAVIAFALWATRCWIVIPIRKLSTTMATIAGGSFEENIEEADRRDEIGAMARAVQIFKDNGIRSRQLEKEAALAATAADVARHRSTEIEQARMEEMTEATRGLAEGLMKLERGNLQFQLGPVDRRQPGVSLLV